MTLKAIELGFVSLGFSGHSPMYFENDWGMKMQDVANYIKDITELKNEYADKIEILCGIELDADYSDINLNDFDYVLASVHQFVFGDEIHCIDYSGEVLANCVKSKFNGSWKEMAKAYYDRLAEFVIETECDIVGHFDLITKFNENNAQFNENDSEYMSIALAAIDKIINAKPDVLFEVNTGAMYRIGNSKPYPAEFILKHLYNKQGKIIITSDSHNVDSLNYAFDETVEYCKKCGFEYAYILRKNGREKVSL